MDGLRLQQQQPNKEDWWELRNIFRSEENKNKIGTSKNFIQLILNNKYNGKENKSYKIIRSEE